MSFNLIAIWHHMGIMSRVVAGCLLLMGIASVSVLVERMWALRKSAEESRRFAAAAAEALETWDLDALVERSRTYSASTLARLFGFIAERYVRAVNEGRGNLSPSDLARSEADRRREQLSAELRRGMSVLASVGSTAPFVGLLGTVLGIISAFQGIGASGGGGLGSVSAGIAEALIETAFGLMVAIPAVYAYNYLTGKVAAVELSLARSAGELLDEMENRDGQEEASQHSRSVGRVAAA